jgi:hypothetical protein
MPLSALKTPSQIPLDLASADEPPPPAPPRPRPPRAAEVEEALSLLRRAVADCGYTVGALEASMGKGRTYIHQVLYGQKSMSVDFFFSLPREIEARFEQLRLRHARPILLAPASADRAARDLLIGLRRLSAQPMEKRVLRRYVATWTDGVTRIIHARRLRSARALASQLEVPPGVFVQSVRPL